MGSNVEVALPVNILKNKGLALCCFSPFLPDGAAILDYDVEASCWEWQGNRIGGAWVPDTMEPPPPAQPT